MLRGGEILKIRGLCRSATAQTQQQQQQQQPQRGEQTAAANYNVQRFPINTGPTSVRFLMEQQQQQHLRGLGASVMPKDSPVIIKSPKPLTTLAMSSASAATTSSLPIPTSACVGLPIKKQVSMDAIDKGVLKAEMVEQPTSMCNEIGCSCSRVIEAAQQQQQAPQPQQQHIIVRRERRQSEEPTVLCRTASNCQEICNERDHMRNANECINRAMDVEKERPKQIYEHELRRSNLATEHMENEYATIPDSYNYSNLAHTSHIKQMKEEPISSAACITPSHSVETKQFVKEEPSDWLPVTSIRHPRMVDTKIPTAHIKTEVNAAAEGVITATQGQKEFERYFKCDICNDTFEDKSALARHVDTHSSTSAGFSKSSSSSGLATAVNVGATHETCSSITKQYVPKKRRRISVSFWKIQHAT